MANTRDARAGKGWRIAALSLSAVLILSWALAAYLAYAFLDTGVSLSYCRSEQDYLKHDLQVLVTAGRGRLSRSTVVNARDEVDPALRGKSDGPLELQLESIKLQFGEDGLLVGVSGTDR